MFICTKRCVGPVWGGDSRRRLPIVGCTLLTSHMYLCKIRLFIFLIKNYFSIKNVVLFLPHHQFSYISRIKKKHLVIIIILYIFTAKFTANVLYCFRRYIFFIQLNILRNYCILIKLYRARAMCSSVGVRKLVVAVIMLIWKKRMYASHYARVNQLVTAAPR